MLGSTLMEQRRREAEAAASRGAGARRPAAELRLHGHLFDSNLINQARGLLASLSLSLSLSLARSLSFYLSIQQRADSFPSCCIGLVGVVL